MAIQNTSLVVSTVTPEAPHRAHLAISQCPVFGHLYLPRFLVSTDRDSQKSLAARHEGPSPQAGEEEERALNGWWAGLPECSYWAIHSDMGFIGPSQGVVMQWQESQLVVMYKVWEATAL